MLLWVHTTTNLMSVHIPLSCYTRSKHNEVNIVVLFLVVLLDIVSPIILFFFKHLLVARVASQSVSHVLLWQPSECVHLIVMIVLCCSRKINMMMMMISLV